ncbi:hypothetical protein J1N35_032847 [Gossypium stocksii]|uniref:Uncharacterized protein n=1 Tax=Gossypium stocksii TaxID=47602 RepID=A0A9D3V4A3_9ROSI|nr:hypothetical protein J1N35_032847 [Gossypium stocksii]
MLLSFVLKYLRINHPSLKRRPSSLCNLSDQQTLDIKNYCVKCLQCGIWEMQKLRHLSVPYQTTLPKCSDNGDSCLPHLQTLSATTPNRETAALIIHSRFLNLIKLTLNSLDMGKTKKCL